MLRIILPLIAFSSHAASPEAPVRSLADAYSAALAASEEIASSEQSLRRAQALYRQALGDSLPALSFRSQTSWEDGNRGASESDGAFRLSHAGLNGYRELAEIKKAKAEAKGAVFERRQAEQLLLGDLARAYYGLLQSKEDAAATASLKDQAEKRLKELQNRVRLGRSREADAIAQEYQVASLAAQYEESSRLAAARMDMLSYLTKRPIEVSDPWTGPAQEKSLAHYLSRIESRPDVAAALVTAESARHGLRSAHGERLPIVSLQANKYVYRPASRRSYDWDAGATVALPIFSWGAARAEVEAARADSAEADLALSSARRLAELSVKNAHRDLVSARRKLELRKRGLELAEKDYALQRRDEIQSLVTSLEILESLNRLSAARLAFNAADLEARLAAITLELAAGARPQDMELR